MDMGSVGGAGGFPQTLKQTVRTNLGYRLAGIAYLEVRPLARRTSIDDSHGGYTARKVLAEILYAASIHVQRWCRTPWRGHEITVAFADHFCSTGRLFGVSISRDS